MCNYYDASKLEFWIKSCVNNNKRVDKSKRNNKLCNSSSCTDNDKNKDDDHSKKEEDKEEDKEYWNICLLCHQAFGSYGILEKHCKVEHTSSSHNLKILVLTDKELLPHIKLQRVKKEELLEKKEDDNDNSNDNIKDNDTGEGKATPKEEHLVPQLEECALEDNVIKKDSKKGIPLTKKLGRKRRNVIKNPGTTSNHRAGIRAGALSIKPQRVCLLDASNPLKSQLLGQDESRTSITTIQSGSDISTNAMDKIRIRNINELTDLPDEVKVEPPDDEREEEEKVTFMGSGQVRIEVDPLSTPSIELEGQSPIATKPISTSTWPSSSSRRKSNLDVRADIEAEPIIIQQQVPLEEQPPPTNPCARIPRKRGRRPKLPNLDPVIMREMVDKSIKAGHKYKTMYNLVRNKQQRYYGHHHGHHGGRNVTWFAHGSGNKDTRSKMWAADPRFHPEAKNAILAKERRERKKREELERISEINHLKAKLAKYEANYIAKKDVIRLERRVKEIQDNYIHGSDVKALEGRMAQLVGYKLSKGEEK